MRASRSLEDRFEQVLADFLQAEERGERPDLSELLRTEPELETPLCEFFRNRDRFDRLASRLTPTVRHPGVPPQPDLPPVSDFGGYAVLQELGKGGRGIVYRVSDPELNRPLAVKVLRPELREDPDAVRRFQEEAQVMGQLQHPGIVPVHAVGQLPDGRPYFVMKLVEGRTLAQLLAVRTSLTPDLPYFLAVFQQVCQAVAYAHSRGVIHRDLKPANVMVGAFAEVQVMDWGLAKVLASGGRQASRERQRPEDVPDTVRTVRTGASGLSTEDGSVVGTFAYMAPEQANGHVEELDPRADVFGLGALLCEVLTGLPPYAGVSGWRLYQMAAAGDLAEALARLDRCAADAELIALARDCLAPEPQRRPPDAAAVAERLTAYLAGVEERLRRAELEKAAAQAKAEEARARVRAERRARRLTVGLAVAVLAVVVSLAVGGLWLQRQQAEEARQAEELRREVGALLGQAIRFRQGAHFEESRELLEQAQQRLGTDGPADLRGQVQQALADTGLAKRLDAVRQRELSEVSGGKWDSAGAQREYAAALQEAGLGQKDEDAAVVAARVRASAVRLEVIAALDDWASIAGDGPLGVWLLDVARAADSDPQRDRLRRPELWRDRAALERLAGEVRVGELPPQLAASLGMVLYRSGGDAVPLLRKAQAHHPQDFWLNTRLAMALHKANRWDEVIAYLRAALALRPEAGPHNNLGAALFQKGDLDEAIGHYEKALRIDPKRADTHHNLGQALAKKGNLDGAIKEFREALRLRQDYPGDHLELGNALRDRDLDGAIKAYQAALLLNPDYPQAHHNLGIVLDRKGDLVGAIKEFREALRLKERLKEGYPEAHTNLGAALAKKGDLDGAIKEYRKALALNENFPDAHNNLGLALYEKGDLDGAITEYRKALGLNKDYPEPHCNLGMALRRKGDQEGAIKEYREALRLRKDFAIAHYNLGIALQEKGDAAGAIQEYREALLLKKDIPEAHVNLGLMLGRKGDREGEIQEYRKALALKNDLPQAHYNLGVALFETGQFDEGIDHCTKAVAIDPRNAKALCTLGTLLSLKGRLEEAVSRYRQTLKVNPNYAEAYGALGRTLLALGSFAEGREATDRCLKLLPQPGPLRERMEKQMERCNRILFLEARVPALLRGEYKPARATEMLEFGWIFQATKRYADAVRLCSKAFDADPKQADDLQAAHRYHAACCAALAAAALEPNDKERLRLQGKALDWLRADLALWKKHVETGNAWGSALAQRVLWSWQREPGLTSVRDKEGLATLPGPERKAWEQFWDDVEALRKQARQTKSR
jgi:serine/threonine-protein kinase